MKVKKLFFILFMSTILTAFQAFSENQTIVATTPSLAGQADEGAFQLYSNGKLIATTTFIWKADGSYESGTTSILMKQSVYSEVYIEVDKNGQWTAVQRKTPQEVLTVLRRNDLALVTGQEKTTTIPLKPESIPMVSRNPALWSMAVRAYDEAKNGPQTMWILSVPDNETVEMGITRLAPVEGPVKGRPVKLTPFILKEADGRSLVYVDAENRVILFEIPSENKIYIRQGYEELFSFEDPFLAAKADARLKSWFEANQPGAVVLLMQNDKILFQKGYGLANVELNVAIQPDMIFRIGSITKQFTAAAVMVLAEEGKVDLNTSIANYLENLPKAWKKITVEQLLNHTSGIPDYSYSKIFWKHMHENLTPIDLLELYVSKFPLDFEPGTQYRYTNTGYIVLGMLIEKITGQSYGLFLQKRFFESLDLKHTRYARDTDLVPGMVSGYASGLQPAPFWSATQKYAAGALVSNAEDLARWTLALHSGKVVNPESLNRMLKPTRLKNGEEIPYGFGLAFRKSKGNLLVGHGGSVSGFRCTAEADPESKTVAVILNNRNDPRKEGESIVGDLLRLTAGKSCLKLIPAAIEPYELKRLAGRYKFGALARTITFDGRYLYDRSESGDKRRLIPLSETKFGYDDYEDAAMRLRFELVGYRVMGVRCGHADDVLEQALQKRMEPIEDKNPKVTALVRQFIREAIDGTLKPEMFTPNLAAKIFPDQVNEAAALLKSLGPQTGIELYESEKMPGSSVCRYLYRLGYGDKHVILRLALLEDKRISEIDFSLE
jgi:serine beta-lactamase-like protein LACTB